jgi:hypothetical protein
LFSGRMGRGVFDGGCLLWALMVRVLAVMFIASWRGWCSEYCLTCGK